MKMKIEDGMITVDVLPRPMTADELNSQFCMIAPQAIQVVKMVLEGDIEKVSARDRLEAAKLVFERGYGKSAQSVTIKGDEAAPLCMSFPEMSVEALAKIASIK